MTPTTQFNLVVTRNADFNTNKNDSLATAQPFSGNTAILGAISQLTAPIYTLDDNLTNPPFPIWQTNTTNGTFIPPSIPAPATTENNPFGLNMAYDGTYLYYNNGSQFGDNTIYKIDAATGAVVASGIPAGTPLFTGLAYLNGELYGIAGFTPTIYVIDPNTFQVVNRFPTNIANTNVVGLAGDPDRGVLWAITQPDTTNGDIDEIDPTTGNVIASAPDNHLG